MRAYPDEYVAERREVAPDLIVEIIADSDPMSPREWDNLSVIYGDHRRYEIGDGKPPEDEARALDRGGWPLLRRYLRTCKGALAVTRLGMYDHSDVSYYPVADGSNGTAAFDSAGWDSGVVGYAYVTQARAEELGAPLDSLAAQMAGEIEEYSDWASGNVWGYRVTRKHDPECDAIDCPHDTEVASCWGYIGDTKYALEEGMAAAAAQPWRYGPGSS